MMISESGTVEAMLRGAAAFNPFGPPTAMPEQHQRVDRMDPMQNQLCRVCEEPAAGFHFGAFTCEGCKSFFGRTCNNQSVIQECKNNYRCVVDKKNRTACKACRLRKCLMVGMSKSGSRYGRRSNWFKIHCLMQQAAGKAPNQPQQSSSPQPPSLPTPPPPPMSSLVIPSPKSSSLSPTSPPRSAPAPSAWSKTAKELLEERAAAKDFRTASSSPPTMAPKSSLLPPASPPTTSPFHALFQASSSSISPSSSSPMSPPLNNSKPSSPVSSASPVPSQAAAAAAAAAAAFQHHPLSSLYGSAFPHLGLMSTPGFPGLPLHKQMLLSPLLAQSHLWQQMAAQSRQYPSPLSPLFAGLANPAAVPSPPAAPSLPIPKPTPSKPEVDVMAEHKALMERFASQMNAAALAAAAAQQAAQAAQSDEEKEEPVKPKPSSNPNIPMDLSSRIAAAAAGCKEDDEEDLDVGNEGTAEGKEVKMEEPEDVSSFRKIVIKSDLNRNTVLQDSDKE